MMSAQIGTHKNSLRWKFVCIVYINVYINNKQVLYGIDSDISDLPTPTFDNCLQQDASEDATTNSTVNTGRSRLVISDSRVFEDLGITIAFYNIFQITIILHLLFSSTNLNNQNMSRQSANLNNNL